MIDKDTIDKIFDAARVEEVVGEFVTLKKAGSNFKGLSPFSNEKTPSFVVSPAKGIWKDFSSGKGGNVVSFLMEAEQMSYPEALRWLAAKYNIEIVEKEKTPEEQEKANKRESLFLVSKFAEEYFIEQLHESEEGKNIGLSYFHERGFRDDIIKKFGLGYSPDEWEAFTKAALGAGYKAEYLVEAGLIKQKEERRYDFFKGRIIFPIHNLTGRAIGFGARTLKTDKKTPKYLNSPETDIYNKSRVLYGIYQGKAAISKADNCFLVEGYTDVISLHQSGIENVVASSGTALTKEQIRLINRYTKNITILYDGDAAGIRASFRGIDLILEEGMNVKVILFPDGEDPDSFARSKSSSELEAFLDENKKDFIVFKTDLLIEETSNDPIKRASLVHEIVNSIALIPDMITRQVYLQECSRLLDIPEQTLINELNKVRRKKVNKQSANKKPDDHFLAPHPDEPPPDFGEPYSTFVKEKVVTEPQITEDKKLAFQESDVIRILLHYGHYMIPMKFAHPEKPDEKEEYHIPIAHFIIVSLEEDQVKFKNPTFQKIVDYYAERLAEDEDAIPSDKELCQHQDPDIAKMAADLFSERYGLSNWRAKQIYVTTEDMRLKKSVLNAVYSLKLAHLEARIYEVQELMQVAENERDESVLQMENIELLEARKRFAVALGRDVTQ